MALCARNDFRLKKRVARLFGASNAPEIPARDPVIGLLCGEFEKVSIFGGVIREMALGGPESFRSDIDIVVDAKTERIAAVLRRFNCARNKFGGFRLATGGRHYDVWSLDSTWAFRQGHVQRTGGGFTDLLKTTFFNVDAVVMSLPDGRLRYSVDFRDGIKNRELDVNLKINPCLSSMAKRTNRFALRGFRVTDRLREFLRDHLLVAAQKA